MAQQRFHYEVNGSVLETGDEILDGRQIRSSAQLAPPSAFALVRTDEGIGQAIGLEEEVRLAPGATARFQAFESDRIFTFTVDERGWEWGTDEIAEAEIRRIAAIPDDRELFLDSDQDQPIPHGGKIRLSGKGVERVRSRPWTVHILVNAREHVVAPGTISFEELVALAFPQPPTGPQVCFTVSYRKGPPPRPEGSLLPGQSVHVIEGMTFHVTATDKS